MNIIVFEAWVLVHPPASTKGDVYFLAMAVKHADGGIKLRTFAVSNAERDSATASTFGFWIVEIVKNENNGRVALAKLPVGLRRQFKSWSHGRAPVVHNELAAQKVVARAIQAHIGGETGWQPGYSGVLSCAPVPGREGVSPITHHVPIEEVIEANLGNTDPGYEDSDMSFAERRRLRKRAKRKIKEQVTAPRVKAYHPAGRGDVAMVQVPVTGAWQADGVSPFHGTIVADNPEYATIQTTAEALTLDVTWFVGPTITEDSWFVGESKGAGE